MISLKRYLDAVSVEAATDEKSRGTSVLPFALAAHCSSLHEMGDCSAEVCPGLGDGLKSGLEKLASDLCGEVTRESLASTDNKIRETLRDWSRKAIDQNEQRTREIKEILIVMARTAESVGERDQRCAQQINDVTWRLHRIASLDDLSEIRASIEESATELKTSIDRMAAEGKAAIEQLKSEIEVYQVRLKAAEKLSARDSLTGLRSRLRMETELDRRASSDEPFCVAIIDIDGFKQVNDEYGHVVGDELLKQFAAELKSASRSADIVGRWGGDEFMIVLDCPLSKASSQIERLREWICGDYMVHGAIGLSKLRVGASIGLAEHKKNEPLKRLIDRADAEMYKQKAATRNGAKR